MAPWWSLPEAEDAPLKENGGSGTSITANDVCRRLTGTNGRMVENPCRRNGRRKEKKSKESIREEWLL